MNILLINLNQERMPDPVPPIGLTYIAASIKRDNHVCKIYDLNFIINFQDDLSRIILEFKPQVIGLSMRNVDNTAYPVVTSYVGLYKEIVALCRKVVPDVPIVLGGSAFSLFPHEFMNILKADYGIVGEGENSFRKLLWLLEKKSQDIPKIMYPELPVDLDELMPARELLDVDSYFREGGSLNIQTKRGCSFTCSFCSYPVLEGKRIRKRSPKKVVDELEHCYKEYGVDYFFFVDNVFNIPQSHSIAIAEEIIERKLPINWTAYFKPIKLTEKAVQIYKEAGCSSIDFGTDAASPETLKSLGKTFSVKDIQEASRVCRLFGIKFNHSLIFGAPGETKASVEETISNIVACEPTSVIAIIGVRLFRSTPLARKLVDEGYFEEKDIGISPVFYIEDLVRDYIIERLNHIADTYHNWIVPGLNRKVNKRYFKRLRARGLKGPLWEALG